MARVRPLTGTDRFRLICIALGLIHPDELTQTRDQKRLFVDGGEEIVAPFHHGDIASQAAMLALNGTSDRGCHRGDKCKRSDINALAECIANRGEALSDWDISPLSYAAGGYGDVWGFVIEDDDLCIEFDADGNPFIAIEEIT